MVKDVYFKKWEALEEKATAILVHGIGEHCHRYEHVAKALNNAGISLIGFDLPGHGKTPGHKGYFQNMEETYAVIDAAFEMTDPSKPVFLYGHSMGGNIATNYILDKRPKIRGAVITSPWYTIPVPLEAIVVPLVKIIDKLAPKLQLSSGLRTSNLSRDKKEVKKYEEDPLVHSKITPHLFVEFYDRGKKVLERGKEMDTDILLLHGDHDKICNLTGSKALNEATDQRLTLKVWKDGYHELHNDLEKELVIKEIVTWMKERIDQYL